MLLRMQSVRLEVKGCCRQTIVRRLNAKLLAVNDNQKEIIRSTTSLTGYEATKYLQYSIYYFLAAIIRVHRLAHRHHCRDRPGIP